MQKRAGQRSHATGKRGSEGTHQSHHRSFSKHDHDACSSKNATTCGNPLFHACAARHVCTVHHTPACAAHYAPTTARTWQIDS